MLRPKPNFIPSTSFYLINLALISKLIFIVRKQIEDRQVKNLKNNIIVGFQHQQVVNNVPVNHPSPTPKVRLNIPVNNPSPTPTIKFHLQVNNPSSPTPTVRFNNTAENPEVTTSNVVARYSLIAVVAMLYPSYMLYFAPQSEWWTEFQYWLICDFMLPFFLNFIYPLFLYAQNDRLRQYLMSGFRD